ncbi:DDB1- and CUL4-associated factor homolog 1 [Impatiens glandulifera]|uniref:DDB1- and CUL4-associated factor homolog 1 n=1 Tax=Impatiens glandulifera TaxID=253017 RepID=UPI001FB0AEA6|nr:DDB1- and CUL4-associated factor homolog 1 [Impatiens glandulifera]
MDAAMDQTAAAGDTAPTNSPPPAPTSAEQEEQESTTEEDKLFVKAQELMDKITASSDNPNPNVLHALASMLETQESRYMEKTGHSSLNNARASHTVGKLGNLIRENDEFFELISLKFLSETRYPVSVQAATARLLFSCSLTWMYPHAFEDNVLDKFKSWVMDDISRFSAEDHNSKYETGTKRPSHSEILKAFSTGLLAVCLTGGGHIVEDALTSGLSAKLMRYLRIRTLGEISTSQKDSNVIAESKPSASCTRGREENKTRLRQASEISISDAPRIVEEGTLNDQGAERDSERRHAVVDKHHLDTGEPPDNMAEDLDTCDDLDGDGENRRHGRESRDGRIRIIDKNTQSRSTREEDIDESSRDELSRRRTNRSSTKSRGKARSGDDVLENEQALTSPASGSRFGSQMKNTKDRSINKTLDLKRPADSKIAIGRFTSDGFVIERDENDECFQGCKFGCRDITDLVRKAVRSAEAEARAANAPAEATKAAGDAAAEVVKSAALEELEKSNDEEAAYMAASRVASTVIDAASAVEFSRISKGVVADTTIGNSTEPEKVEEDEEFFIIDYDSLAKLREKFCIQCLVALGEYVEVLGPVLHEKGVDVCLALLQRSLKYKEASKIADLLPDVLKLICNLVAHRKFAALFLDRNGMQKLLGVPRVMQTFVGLSSCLFTISSIQGIMERLCALPTDIVQLVVALVLELLHCPQDQARKNAALTFSNAFVFRAVLDAFDSQEGLQKCLSLLQDAASVRSGVTGALGSSSGSLRNERSPADVLTSSEKQIAYHTCVALRQYFRAHLLLLVDSIRPYKGSRSGARNFPGVRAGYKPLDLSNEAMDATFLQIQKDRKLGPAFVRARWPAVDKFLASNGHVILLELCQAPTVDRYLHDLLQYALGILHIVTLVPYSRKQIVSATVSNDRLGIAVILDAANGAGFMDPEIIQPALNVLVNLVCPPPSISNKPLVAAQGQPLCRDGPPMESRNSERNVQDKAINLPGQNEPKDQNGESNVQDQGGSAVRATSGAGGTSQTPVASGLVGDRRISLGAGSGCAGLAAQLEQWFRQAREAVRANNGIKVLLQLLQPRIVTPSAALDCLRALACRVLLGLARDDAIAHILTKLQVGKKLSELIRDSGSHASGSEQSRWQAELAQVAIELIAVVTNSGRASTLAATDAATSTLRRIERAAIAAATPITYHSGELLQLIHEHLLASGMATAAAALLKEAQLTPLPLSATSSSSSVVHQSLTQDTLPIQIHWPSGRTPSGFLSNKLETPIQDEDSRMKCEPDTSSKKKSIVFSPSLSFPSRNHTPLHDSNLAFTPKFGKSSKKPPTASGGEIPSASSTKKTTMDTEMHFKTPILLPMKRKLTELKEIQAPVVNKRPNIGEQGLRSPVFLTPSSSRKTGLAPDGGIFSTPTSQGRLLTPYSNNLAKSMDETPHLTETLQPIPAERLTLDSIVVQYLKHQHRQCPAPITTLPPLSLLHAHVCPEPKQNLDAPVNITARLSTRDFRSMYGGIHGNRKDRQFIYSRFRPWRTCRDDATSLLTCVSFLGDSSQVACGTHNGELKVFDCDSNNVLESCSSHQFPLTFVQSHQSVETQLILSSSAHDVRLWDAASVSAGPRHCFDGCKAAKFNNSASSFAALSPEPSRREILLYDVQTCQLELKLSDTSAISSARGHAYSHVHFSPSDSMLLWNGVLWDRRGSGPVHRFDQFTDYGGGGFHPSGNEVIINSEVWDLRKFRLLRSVPSLDQTMITFNASGDVIYAILRRNFEEITSAFNTRRVKHPLFQAFRTVDAVNYSDIATVTVDRCVLDFATEPTDSFVGLVTMDDPDGMHSSARVYEIGRRRSTDDDSDPDDAETEEDDDEDDDGDDESLLGPDIDGDGDSSDGDDLSNDDDDDGLSDLDDDDDDDGDFLIDDVDIDEDGGLLEIIGGGGDEDDDEDGQDDDDSISSGDEDDFVDSGFGF